MEQAELINAPVMKVVQKEPDVAAWIKYLQEYKRDAIIDLDIIICDVFRVDPDRLFTRTRIKEIKNARFAYWYVMNRWFKYSFKALSRITTWDHSNILVSCKTVENFMATEPDYHDSMIEIKDCIKSSMVRVPADPNVEKDGYNLVFKGEQIIHSSKIENVTDGS